MYIILCQFEFQSVGSSRSILKDLDYAARIPPRRSALDAMTFVLRTQTVHPLAFQVEDITFNIQIKVM
jgi:hypothetical protein